MVQTYFIHDGTHVKIGHTDRGVMVRLRELQTGCATPLVVLHVIDGDHEETLKNLFIVDRIRPRGEWFRYSDDIKKFIGAPGPFYVWMMNRSRVNDTTQDFIDDSREACDVFPMWPRVSHRRENHLNVSALNFTYYDQLKGFLRDHSACREAFRALATLYREWQISQRLTV